MDKDVQHQSYDGTEVKRVRDAGEFTIVLAKLLGAENAVLLIQLTKLFDDSGRLAREQPEIAEALNINIRTLQRKMKKIVNDGGLSVEHRTGREVIYTLGPKVRECIFSKVRESALC